ncbi:nuclease-related domain-containing protein [Streptomyces sp. NPDC001889]
MAIRLRAAERARQHRTARWIIPPAAVLAAAVGYVAAGVTGSWTAGTIAATTILIAALRRTYRTRGSSWATGAAGERRTARLLAPLTWLRSYVVLHDRAIPGSRANLDSLVIGRTGVIYVDTKNWTSTKSRVRIDHRGELWYGRFSQTRALATVRWEADQAAKALGWPVHAVVAVHGAKVPGGRIQLDNVTLIQATKLRRYLRSLPSAPGWDRAMVRETAQIADLRLRPAAAA